METEPRQNPQNRLYRWEYFALVGGFLLLWFGLAKFALGGPNSSDVTWYYHVGANNLTEPFLLNRYFHIFLQKFFVGTQPEPLLGLQFFWAFLLASTAVILYLSARLLSPTSSPWNGILALVLFFSLPAVSEVSGIPYVDVTAMMMLSSLLLVYILSANAEHQKWYWLALFGCLLFLGFKTKETVLPAAILVLGYGIQDRQIAWRLGAKRVLWVLLGVLAGLTVLTLLNALVLRDAFFGLRPTDITQYLGTYFSGTSLALDTSTTRSWIDGFLLPSAFLPLLLTIISGIQNRTKISLNRQLLWLLPLAFIALLTLSINNKWGYQTRFALPVLPLFCVLGAQVIEIPARPKRGELLAIIIGSVVFVALCVGLLSLPRANYYLILAPMLFIALLCVFFFANSQKLRGWLILALLFLVSVVPLYDNLYAMAKEQPNRQAFVKTTLPFTSFKDELKLTPDSRLLVDAKVNPSAPLKILKNEDELFTTYNIVFDANTIRQNFRLANSVDKLRQEILSRDYQYVLLGADTWFQLEKDPLLTGRLSSGYEHIASPDNNFILLVAGAAGN